MTNKYDTIYQSAYSPPPPYYHYGCHSQPNFYRAPAAVASSYTATAAAPAAKSAGHNCISNILRNCCCSADRLDRRQPHRQYYKPRITKSESTAEKRRKAEEKKAIRRKARDKEVKKEDVKDEKAEDKKVKDEKAEGEKTADDKAEDEEAAESEIDEDKVYEVEDEKAAEGKEGEEEEAGDEKVAEDKEEHKALGMLATKKAFLAEAKRVLASCHESRGFFRRAPFRAYHFDASIDVCPESDS